MDAFPSLDSSSSAINHQEEDEDDWVVIKKQKIIILIPPPSPPPQQIVKQMSSKSTKQIHVDDSARLDPNPEPQQPESSLRPHGVGTVGALKVVNRRIQAMNIRRKLQSLGGMRTWLSSLRLERFAEVFEREEVGEYQLVNLSASKLKDMGVNAVGTRRKLLHAIELLCQPYYSHGFSSYGG
ncbi:uncharacterized protein LOC110034269 [Phalaenopsis equestris]|uniref:uncharacterized protein LOC110034269 n=1 Tax=Phalaenopsis equestris TaxID=78828 RepID=UPI0009E4E3A5|nr:uncharacterized protein LOC110034269 [Phalaenopsis equestris]